MTPREPLFAMTPAEAGLLEMALNAYSKVPRDAAEDAYALSVRLRAWRERQLAGPVLRGD